MDRLTSFLVFHLNLAFSSLEESRRPVVIERCYWPLLRLALDGRARVGVEMSGMTVECIARLDPAWIDAFKEAVDANACELVGSGYAQLIGPLVPADVNRANQWHGLDMYTRVLGIRPRVALVNEQAYSAGMVAHYLDAGYEAIIMEWNNPASAHPEWPSEWRYHPQVAAGLGGCTIPVLWNQSIAFQKFQRYVHGETELEEYCRLLESHVGGSGRVFALYGNDAEVFDFRPGRFHTEADLSEASEWERIGVLLDRLREDARFELVLPSEAVSAGDDQGATAPLELESPAKPIPVKKQSKYNILRWAVTGRNDTMVNTRCRNIRARLREGGVPVESDAWRRLCALWSSDLRTHITEARWAKALEDLEALQNETSQIPVSPPVQSSVMVQAGDGTVLENGSTEVAHTHAGIRIGAGHTSDAIGVSRDRRYVRIDSGDVQLSLDTAKGLAIERLAFNGGEWLLGTLPHGFFQDIQYGADFYSGHLVFQAPGAHQVTDLAGVEPAIVATPDEVTVTVCIPSPFGPLEKVYRVVRGETVVRLSYRFGWEGVPRGTLRLGLLTLNPAAFDRADLACWTHNGGDDMERFGLGNDVDHGKAISTLVSAGEGLGVTEGVLMIGVPGRRVQAEEISKDFFGVALCKVVTVGDSWLGRSCFSLGEYDDTVLTSDRCMELSGSFDIRISLLGGQA